MLKIIPEEDLAVTSRDAQLIALFLISGERWACSRDAESCGDEQFQEDGIWGLVKARLLYWRG